MYQVKMEKHFEILSPKLISPGGYHPPPFLQSRFYIIKHFEQEKGLVNKFIDKLVSYTV